MKKFVVCLIAVALACGICFSGCGDNVSKNQIREELSNSVGYPYYRSLSADDREIYMDICAAIENFESLNYGKFDTYQEARTMAEKVANIFSSLIYEQPQYFWIDPYGISCRVIEQTGNELIVSFPRFASEKEVEEQKKELDEKVSEIVSVAETKRTAYERALYVYEQIMENTVYHYALSDKIDAANQDRYENFLSGEAAEDISDIGQTAYGCLVEGKTVCSGYALAFNLVMQELGYECGAVSNKGLTGTIGLFAGYHVSNYCKLDGEYYYFDLTWDDTGFDSDTYKKYMDYSHRFFAITKEEFEKTHLIDEGAYAPEATAIDCNYFVKQNAYFEKYDEELVKQSILSQIENGYIVLKFGDYGEVYEAEAQLIEGQKIYSLIGKNQCSYLNPEFSTLLYIFF